jgi:hypothetical protein
MDLGEHVLAGQAQVDGAECELQRFHPLEQ